MSKLQHQLKIAAILSVLISGVFTTFQSALALDSAGEGRRAWLKYNCYGCHGMRAGGGMGPRLAGESEDVLEAVLKGEDGGMRSYKNIVNTTEINNLMAYLRTIKDPNQPPAKSEPVFMHWWEANPSK